MDLKRIIVKLILIVIVNAKIIKNDNLDENEIKKDVMKNSNDDFDGVYSECFVVFSFKCIQKKTLAYLKHLNRLSEVSFIGEYVKFVRLNTTNAEDEDEHGEKSENNSEDLTQLIDKAIDRFFDNHIIKFSAMGNDIAIPNNAEEFVGRKKRKGGGGGGMAGHDEGHFSHKKMMMMAMMCMKMKMMMMVPAMMGMMGMMSFKGMMFSMMSFMISKMLLLMKILEKKGGLGASSIGGSAADGGWAVGGGSGGAWMPAGGQDFNSGGGYDANGQWQSRSIIETKDVIDKPEIFYKPPILTYINPIKLYNTYNKNNEVIKINKKPDVKSRQKRSIIDVLQNSYIYWINKLLGVNNNRRTFNNPKYKIVNGIKYIYYPYKNYQQKYKTPKAIDINKIKNSDEESSIITAEDFNKGEIVEGDIESRMIRKKFQKMKNTVNDTLDDNPWE